jgi:CheY-like chemotaxis protein
MSPSSLELRSGQALQLCRRTKQKPNSANQNSGLRPPARCSRGVAPGERPRASAQFLSACLVRLAAGLSMGFSLMIEGALRSKLPDYPWRPLISKLGYNAGFVIRQTDCLVLDVRMPGIGSLELQRRLNAAQSRVPIIFVTAHDDKSYRMRAMGAGAANFFHKPFEAKAFVAAIQVVLRSRPSSGSSTSKKTEAGLAARLAPS